MSDYIKENKKAWEEAFNNSSKEYTKKTEDLLNNHPKQLFTSKVNNLLAQLASKDKVLGQFCCNNGRETLASLAYGFHESVGFDIAGNMVDYGNRLASELSLNSRFFETDILEIDSTFEDMFDVGLMTVGAISWFKDLKELFRSIHKTLKVGAHIIIEDMHPVTSMLAAKSEKEYDANHPSLIVYDYFKKTPWVEVEGMGYMTGKNYQSETFTSYSHPMMEIINGLIDTGFEILFLEENNVDQSNMFGQLNQSMIPLTFVLHAKKVR